jgi:hypothetical protein
MATHLEAAGLTGRTRYRESLFGGRLVLQVEERRARARVHGAAVMTTRWRDATPGDLKHVEYERAKADAAARGKAPPPPPDW